MLGIQLLFVFMFELGDYWNERKVWRGCSEQVSIWNSILPWYAVLTMSIPSFSISIVCLYLGILWIEKTFYMKEMITILVCQGFFLSVSGLPANEFAWHLPLFQLKTLLWHHILNKTCRACMPIPMGCLIIFHVGMGQYVCQVTGFVE